MYLQTSIASFLHSHVRIDQSYFKYIVACYSYSYSYYFFLYNMGNNNSLAGGGSGSGALRKHIETASKTGVLQYDNKKLKEVNTRMIKFLFDNNRTVCRLIRVFACRIYGLSH